MKQTLLQYLLICMGLTASTNAVAQPCIPEVNLGNSISFCAGNTIELNAYNPNATYTWSTGATSASITVGTTGTYWVQVSNSCGSTSDTIQINASTPLQIALGPDRAICSNASVNLRAPLQAGTTYSWSTGSSSNNINISKPGTYYVTATNACGTFTDTVRLSSQTPAQVNLGPDIVKCTENSLILHSGNSPGARQWSTGSAADSIQVTTAGTYWVEITNACGSVSDTINVNFAGQYNLIPDDTVNLCRGSTATVSTSISGNYLWSNNSTGPAISVSQPGTYWLRLTDNCGIHSDTVVVTEVPEPVVSLPNDTTICSNQSLRLSTGNNTWPHLWSNGSTSSAITVNKPGNYWVRLYNGCRYFYDTIAVAVTPVPTQKISDTISICSGSTIQLNAGNFGPVTNYSWSNGGSSRSKSFSSPGSYSVTVSNTCASKTFDFYLQADQPRNIDLGPDTLTTCSNSLLLNASGAESTDSIVWSTGASEKQIRVRNSGLYYVDVYNSCGVFSDSIVVTLVKQPQGIQDDTINLCDPAKGVVLQVAGRSQTQYNWSHGASSRSTRVYTAGTYSVTINNICGSLTDSVYVQAETPLNVQLGADQSFCPGGNATITAGGVQQADSIRWNDGPATAQRTFTSPGTYILYAYNGCGVFSDTVQLSQKKVPRKVLQPKSLCAGSSLTLNAAQANATNYNWNTGSQSSSINVSSPGWYYVDISNSCQSIRDSVLVSQDESLNPVNLGNDTLFCAGNLQLDAGAHSGASYLWQDGSTSRYFTASQSGTYHVKVQNSCGVKRDTINVQVTGPPKIVLGTYVAYCATNTLTLNAQNPGSTYKWSTGATTQKITVTKPGSYWVDITNDCGTVSDTVIARMEAPPEDFELGPDTTICAGDTLELKTGYPKIATQWQDGSIDHTFQVTEAGTYYATLSNSCGDFRDSIQVSVRSESPSFDLGSDTSLCVNSSSVNLSVNPDFTSYAWSTGDTTKEITVSVPGTYSVTTTDFCGYTFTDSIYVAGHNPVEVDLGPDTVLCQDSVYYISTGITQFPVVWNDGFVGSERVISKRGTYIASTRNACGYFSDTIVVSYKPAPDLQMEERAFCRDDSVLVNVNTFLKQSDFNFQDFDIYWEDGNPHKERWFNQEGEYELYFTDYCQTYSKTYQLKTELCICPVFIPSAFTPNNDGTNDYFTVGGACEFTHFHLRVFSRWGQLVFESYDPNEGWDGRNNGKKLNAGTYTYFFSYGWSELEQDHSRETQGVITLLR